MSSDLHSSAAHRLTPETGHLDRLQAEILLAESEKGLAQLRAQRPLIRRLGKKMRARYVEIEAKLIGYQVLLRAALEAEADNARTRSEQIP